MQGPRAEILLSNPAALELLGLTEDQLLGKTSFDPEWKVIHEDGSPFPGDTHPVPVAIATRKAVHGVIMGFIVLFLKITFGC
jgi:PAS domain-containing protein